MTERKPDASSQPFAELVVDIEDTIQYLKSDSRMYKHLTILLACIREQQAAAVTLLDWLGWSVPEDDEADELANFRAVLARWRIE